MSTRYIPLLALALAMPLASQEGVVEAKAKPQDLANTFYRAFYLERGERRHQEAIDLYKVFLAAAPNHRYSGKAANSLVNLLNRVGKVEEAASAEKQYAAVLKKARAEQPPDERGRGRGGFGRGNRGGRGGRGGFGGRGRGGFGGFNRKPITDMNEDELDGFVDRTNRGAEMIIARLEDGGKEELAKKLEKQVDTVIKLIDEGKKQEAQKAYEEYTQSLRAAFEQAGFRGRGGFGRGGNRGNRGGRRGGRNLRMPTGLEAPLAQMDDETREKKVKFLVQWTNSQLENMRGEQAESLKGNLAEFQKLVEKKDWKAADELVNKVMTELSGGNRRGEGRRRRGGDDRGGERGRRRGGEGRREGEGRKEGEEGGTGRIK